MTAEKENPPRGADPGVAGSRAPQLTGSWSIAYRLAGVGMGVFALWAAGPGIPEEHLHLGIYTLITWLLTLILYPARKGMPWRAPDWKDWELAGVLVIFVALSIFRAEAVSKEGASLIDWLVWTTALVAAAYVLRRPQALTLALMCLSLLCLAYYIHQYRELIDRVGAWTVIDFWMAALAIALALEISRRGLGPWIAAIAIFALFYAYFGSLFPAQISHRGSTLHQIVNYTLYSQEGIFGVMTNVMATYVLVFIYLGAFMNRSGMGRFFIDMPQAIAGRTAGGPAKVAVIASAVFGSISGSSLANIVSTGTFTIPLMKRVGFKPHVSGAVENSASLGGQLLPPVMGSGAFVMAEITGVPYVNIMGLAAIPALLYFLSIGVIVHLEAKKHGIRGMPESELESPSEVFRRGWFHLVPLIVLLAFLIKGYSPDWCAAMAILTVVVINWFRIALARFAPRQFERPKELMNLRGIMDSLVEGTENSLIVGSAAAAVGIVVGIVALTGLGLKMSYLLVAMSGGSLLMAILLVALASLVLGMALPITASYLVLVVLAGPALQSLGVPLIAAHMIVFWLSQDSNITPPVCLGAYVAAAIAGADPWKTGWTSFRFAKMLYVVPLLFAYTPILMTGSLASILWTIVFATLGTIAFSALTMLYIRQEMNVFEIGLMGLASFFCFFPIRHALGPGIPGYVVNLAGVFLFAVVMFMQFRPLPSRAAA